MDDKKMIGSRLKEFRKKFGYSQEQVAERADMASNYLSRLEMGKENPTVDTLLKLSRAYKVELWELLNYGHELDRKTLETRFCRIAKNAKEGDLRLIVKFINTIMR